MIYLKKWRFPAFMLVRPVICPACKREVKFYQKNGLWYLKRNKGCSVCGKKNYFVSSNRYELIFLWNAFVKYMFNYERVRLTEIFPPSVRYESVLTLIDELTPQERKLVAGFLRDFYLPDSQTSGKVERTEI